MFLSADVSTSLSSSVRQASRLSPCCHSLSLVSLNLRSSFSAYLLALLISELSLLKTLGVPTADGLTELLREESVWTWSSGSGLSPSHTAALMSNLVLSMDQVRQAWSVSSSLLFREPQHELLLRTLITDQSLQWSQKQPDKDDAMQVGCKAAFRCLPEWKGKCIIFINK